MLGTGAATSSMGPGGGASWAPCWAGRGWLALRVTWCTALSISSCIMRTCRLLVHRQLRGSARRDQGDDHAAMGKRRLDDCTRTSHVNEGATGRQWRTGITAPTDTFVAHRVQRMLSRKRRHQRWPSTSSTSISLGSGLPARTQNKKVKLCMPNKNKKTQDHAQQLLFC